MAMDTTTRDSGDQRPRVGRIDAARLAAVKQQQILVTLVQQLAEAQFRRGDQPRSQRLWQELAQLELEPERATHLLYAGVDLGNRQALLELDSRWCAEQAAAAARRWQAPAWLRGSRRRGRGLSPQRPSGAHRTARPAVAR
jgi:hypothetical protein